MGQAAGSLDELIAETAWLRALARALIQDRAEADDLAHDAYELAARKAPADDAVRRPWLGRVIVNLVRTRRRSILRRERRERAIGELAPAPPTPAELVERIEIHRRLAELVLALAPPLRDVVVMRYVEGLTSVAIAARLGIAPGTARWRLKQALDQLRAELDARAPRRAWVGALAAVAGETGRGTLALGTAAALLLAAVVVLAVAAHGVVDGPLAAPVHVAAHRHEPPRPARLDGAPPVEAAAGVMMMWRGGRPQREQLAGTVVDAAGRPVADAAVAVAIECDFGVDRVPELRTAADGGFAVEVEPGCHYWVHASRDGAAAKLEVDGWGPRRTSRAEVSLALAPEEPVAMTVVDAETGAPIAGATIALDDGRVVTSGGDGGARFALGGARVVVVRAVGHTAAVFSTLFTWPATPPLRNGRRADPRAEADVLRGQLRTVKLAPGAVEVTGVVVDRRGQPVGDAYLRLRSRDPRDPAHKVFLDEVADAHGVFRTWLAPGRSWDFTALGPTRWARPSAPRAIQIDGPVRDLRLEVGHVSALSGVVLDAAGRPAAGAHVYSTQHAFRPVTSDAAGRFEIPQAECPGLMGMTVIARRGELASAPHWFPRGECAAHVELVMPLEVSGVSGIMVDGDGAPVAGGYVRLQGNDALLPHMVLTGDDGRFAFDAPGGPHELFAYRSPDPDVEDEVVVDVHAGDHDVRIVVP